MTIDLNSASPWSGGIDLNDVHTPFDYDLLWDRVKQYASHWVPMLYPNGRLSPDRRELRLSNPQGHAPRKQGSFVVQLAGPSAGSGFEYDGARRYSAQEMVEAKEGLMGQDAIGWLARAVGLDSPWDAPARTATPPVAPVAPVAPLPMPDPDRYAGDVKLIMSKCVPAKGTMVEDYWRGRKLELPDTPDILFCGDISDHAEKVGKPGMIAVIRTPEGKTMAGVHRTFIAPDGSKTKKMIGHCAGGAVRLREMGSDGVLGLSEGIESGAAAMWLYDVPVWATLSTTGMVKFDFTKVPGLRRLIVFADKGEGGENAANTVFAAAQIAGIECEIIYPHGPDDFAKDVEHGRKPEVRVVEPPKPVQGEVLESFDSILSAAREIRMDTPREVRLSFMRRVAVAHLMASDEGAIQRILKSGAGITAAEFRQDLAKFRREAGTITPAVFVPPAAQELIDRYVFIKMLNVFYDLVMDEFITKQAIIDAHTRDMPLNEYGEPESPEKYLIKTPGLGQVCDKLTFLPRGPRVIKEGAVMKLNTWKPSGVAGREGDVSPWLEHLRYLMADNEESFKHFCWWIAHVIAAPEVKILHAPVIVSEAEGIGKSTIAEMLGYILGWKNISAVEQSDLENQFNDWAASKQLVLVSEMRIEGKLSVRNRLAQYITDKMLRVNPKNLRAYEIENVANYLMFSNFRDAAHLRDNDRRFFVTINELPPKPKEYYEHLRHWFFDLGGAEAVVWWAEHYDLNQHKPYERPPETAGKLEMIENSRSNSESMIREMWEAKEHPFLCDIVRPGDVVQYLGKERGVRIGVNGLKEIIRRMGGVEYGTVRLGDGSPKVWIVRNVDDWVMKSAAEIGRAYFKAGDPPTGGYGGVLG